MDRKNSGPLCSCRDRATQPLRTASGVSPTAERADMEAVEALAGAEGGEDTEPEDLVLRFGKPYKFGGQEYTEVDLSGLESSSTMVLPSSSIRI